MNYVTTISITPDQKEWLDKKQTKLSGYIHQKISEDQEREKLGDIKKIMGDYEFEIKRVETLKGLLVRFIQSQGLMEKWLEWKNSVETPPPQPTQDTSKEWI